MAAREAQHSGNVPPYPLAMIVCDAVHREPYTHKVTILGSFSEIYLRRLPGEYPEMAVYVALTNGRGVVPIRLVLIDSDQKEASLFEIESEVEFSGPLQVAELAIEIPRIRYPQPGEYRVQLFSAGNFLIERKFTVVRKESIP